MVCLARWLCACSVMRRNKHEIHYVEVMCKGLSLSTPHDFCHRFASSKVRFGSKQRPKTEDAAAALLQARHHGVQTISSAHINTSPHSSSIIYRTIIDFLQQRGWTRYQYSCWRLDNAQIHWAHIDSNVVGVYMEGRFGVGIFLRLAYQ
jgi:hypothetical protein